MTANSRGIGLSTLLGCNCEADGWVHVFNERQDGTLSVVSEVTWLGEWMEALSLLSAGIASLRVSCVTRLSRCHGVYETVRQRW